MGNLSVRGSFKQMREAMRTIGIIEEDAPKDGGKAAGGKQGKDAPKGAEKLKDGAGEK